MESGLRTDVLFADKLWRHSLDLSHVTMVDSGPLTIIPGDRDGIPACLIDRAAIMGIAMPTHAVAFLQAPRLVGIHCLTCDAAFTKNQLVFALSLPPET